MENANKIFQIKQDGGNCYIDGCDEKTRFSINVCNHNFHICEKHISDFVGEVNDSYKKLQSYIELENKQKEELENMSKELLG